MNEITDLTGLENAFPTARKITVDMATRTAYVFVGCSLQAQVVTGAAFDELVKVLPGEADGSEDQDPPEDQDVSEAAKPTRKRPAKDGQ
ncbi:MAG: hypothetical protein R3C43_19165 [Chloroflexota bacterium]